MADGNSINEGLAGATIEGLVRRIFCEELEKIWRSGTPLPVYDDISLKDAERRHSEQMAILRRIHVCLKKIEKGKTSKLSDLIKRL